MNHETKTVMTTYPPTPTSEASLINRLVPISKDLAYNLPLF